MADGGGVRGLSSLLILQDMMKRINATIKRLAPDKAMDRDLEPQDIFQLVAGTSTGGLITVMLCKLEMTVDECIAQYHEFSKEIFGKKNLRGKITHGLAQEKYSGDILRKCVGDLIERKGHLRDMPMVCEDTTDRVACAVVCREKARTGNHWQLLKKPVCICNPSCLTKYTHSVCDAAQATTAAPTFFPAVKVAGRSYVDGGMEYNNPSYAILNHYRREVYVRESKRKWRPETQAKSIVRHGNLDPTKVRYVNIGTGRKTDEVPERKRDVLAKLVPSFIRTAVFLKETLLQIASDAERTAEVMKTFEAFTHGDVQYDRFSADEGVCFFKLDRWAELDEIGRRTKTYLEKDPTKAELEDVAEEFAKDYLKALKPAAVAPSPTASASASADVPQHPLTPSKSSRPAASMNLTTPTFNSSENSSNSTTPSTGRSSNPASGLALSESISEQSTSHTEHEDGASFPRNDCKADENPHTMTDDIPERTTMAMATNG